MNNPLLFHDLLKLDDSILKNAKVKFQKGKGDNPYEAYSLYKSDSEIINTEWLLSSGGGKGISKLNVSALVFGFVLVKRGRDNFDDYLLTTVKQINEELERPQGKEGSFKKYEGDVYDEDGISRYFGKVVVRVPRNLNDNKYSINNRICDYNDMKNSTHVVSCSGVGGEVIEQCKEKLETSKNIILHGAPGTGKTYLAQNIAALLVSDNEKNYEELNEEQKRQIGFVQFHPSYDYTDFVEGLRPTLDEKGTLGFTREDGIFMEFVKKALGVQKNVSSLDKAKYLLDEYFKDFNDSKENSKTFFKLKNGAAAKILKISENEIECTSNKRKISGPLRITRDNLTQVLAYFIDCEENADDITLDRINSLIGIRSNNAWSSYYYGLAKTILDYSVENDGISKFSNDCATNTQFDGNEEKKYVFIIDEINRGEISKIFGELFFSIDSGYRGKRGRVKTQYNNMMVSDEDGNEHIFKEGFYIPENVYIIGTMNDIDRSVDTFDFAMRRRFRFVEITADDAKGMLDRLGDLRDKAEDSMRALNDEIVEQGLNKNYHIGPAYYLKLNDLGGETSEKFELLWKDYIHPLLQDYFQGMPSFDEEKLFESYQA